MVRLAGSWEKRPPQPVTRAVVRFSMVPVSGSEMGRTVELRDSPDLSLR